MSMATNHPWQQFKPILQRDVSRTRDRYLADWNRRLHLAACAGATLNCPTSDDEQIVAAEFAR